MRLLNYTMGALYLSLGLSLVLINLTTPAYVLLPVDPVLGMPLRMLFWTVGGLAVTAGVLVLGSDRAGWPLLLPAWLAVNLAAYQCALHTQGCNGLGGYMGGFSRTFGISPRIAGTVAMAVPGCFLAAVCGAVCLQLRALKWEAHALKGFCPGCGGHIKFAPPSLGLHVSCPHCKTGIVLYKPGQGLKMSCMSCQGHVEFPPYAEGRKTRCPHCRGEIILRAGTAV